MKIFARIVCFVFGHKEPRFMIQKLDKKSLKPTGGGIFICERCNEICFKYDD